MKNDTKQLLLDAAIAESEESSYLTISRPVIAERAGVAGSLIQYHFKTMGQFRRAIVGEAIRTSNLKILAQALANNDSRALGLPKKTKQKVSSSLKG